MSTYVTDVQKKQLDEDCTPKPSPGSGSSQSPVFGSESSSSSSSSSSTIQSQSSPATPPELSANEGALTTHPTAQEGVLCTDTARVTLCTPTKRPCESASESESEASPEKRARRDEEPTGSDDAQGCTKQKNRRRCHRCQIKLELVQQELGSCRCGYVFCMLHRLPEQHNCLFDHLGRGREEAVLKMVKLDRKVGRSCQRIGEECS
ncbi:AN1-type zinc finger protein 3-like isoform X2 [Denticeps clupeoides]|uniref:AN1-type zinc finger protein 3-like isoform X2 n=1 Tax=Denticeps clupeoides TaxID=299321 RepID=UPI0010A36728|nr:AN1-type zinc finger protein 3-like isoform X2 [Denticeps clupeoides]